MNNFNLDYSYGEYDENNNDRLKIYIKCDDNIEYLFLSGEFDDNKFYGSLKYYGSSSSLGEKYEIYNSDNGYKKMKMSIINDGNEIIRYDLDFKELAIKNVENSINTYNDDQKIEIKNNIDKEDICILNSFSKIDVIKDNVKIRLGLRNLYKFDSQVELCSLGIKILY